MNHSDGQQWRIADGVAWTANTDGVVALALRSRAARPTTLLGTAAFVWEELDVHGPIDSEDLLTNIAAAYEVAIDEVRGDVVGLLAALHESGLVTEERASAAR